MEDLDFAKNIGLMSETRQRLQQNKQCSVESKESVFEYNSNRTKIVRVNSIRPEHISLEMKLRKKNKSSVVWRILSIKKEEQMRM